MRRTVVASVSLLPGLAADLGRVAKELGKPKSEIFREALEAYLRLYRLRKLQSRLKRSGPVRGARSEEDVERLVHDYRRKKHA
jgi:metal-responsive CopG/Arc/MetJ family transcriptional regulator